MVWYDNDWGYFKPSRPRKAKGGIKAQNRRGKFGETWWAKRWIQVLESFNIGARLGRGRSYARNGQVLSIGIKKGSVTARVQGSQALPYNVRIDLKPLSKQAWKQFAEVLCAQPYFTATLMNGQMPQEIEEVFHKAKLSLFPVKLRDLETECSCPDWSNPCKHIAAVYYLLGEEFDRNPFLIFTLRGMEQKELLSLVSALAPVESATKELSQGPHPAVEIHPEVPLAVPLPPEPEKFWGGVDIKNDFLGETIVPDLSAALPKQLGNFPFWRGEERFLDTLIPIYEAASSVGVDVVAETLK